MLTSPPSTVPVTLLTLLLVGVLAACSSSSSTEPTGTIYWREALAQSGVASPMRSKYPLPHELELEDAALALEPCLRMTSETNCADLILEHHPNLRDDALAPVWPGCLEWLPERYLSELLARGVDADAEAIVRTMRQHPSQQANRQAIMARLLEEGAPPDALDSRGSSPLHVAAEQRDRALVELLLKHGADPSLIDRAGQTALQRAQAQGAQDIVQMLSN